MFPWGQGEAHLFERSNRATRAYIKVERILTSVEKENPAMLETSTCSFRDLSASTVRQRALRLLAGVLLIGVGAIHLNLYLTGYRTIPIIGWLFLLQVLTAFGLGTAVILTRESLVSVAGAGFIMLTLVGYLVSLP